MRMPVPTDLILLARFPEDLGICFFLGALGAIIIAAVALSGSQGKQVNEAFARFARQFRGTFRPGDWSDGPAVSFEHNGSSALLDTLRGGTGRGWATQITFAFRRPVPVCLEIDPDGSARPIGRMMALLPAVVGDPAFDTRHRILASDARLARDLLTPSLREDLVRFGDSLGDRIRVTLSRDYLFVRFPGKLRDYNVLHALSHWAFRLHDQLLLVVNQATPDEVAIVEVQTSGAAVAEDAKCGVCGEHIEDERVLCRSCRTPHHRDCWDYNRGCSVYACRETQYVRAGR